MYLLWRHVRQMGCELGRTSTTQAMKRGDATGKTMADQKETMKWKPRTEEQKYITIIDNLLVCNQSVLLNAEVNSTL